MPNFAAGGSKSMDRTEPPVGSKTLHDLYKKYQDKWIVELLFDDLLDWSNWQAAQLCWDLRCLLPRVPAIIVRTGS